MNRIDYDQLIAALRAQDARIKKLEREVEDLKSKVLTLEAGQQRQPPLNQP
jgi:hypothetical protein